MARPNVLDPCRPVTRVVCGGCYDSLPAPNCSSDCIATDLCSPVVVAPPGQKCVNDNVRRPWPSPPPAELGCSPVTVDVSNVPIEPGDEDQGLRLEGLVDYIAGDACLPRVNLTLKTPPWMGSGNTNPIIKTGCGYTSLGGVFRIGNLGPEFDDYATPEDFFDQEYGAESFSPVQDWSREYDCGAGCRQKQSFGSQIAKYNLIGPILATVGPGATSLDGVEVPGNQSVTTTWEYTVDLVGNIKDILTPNVNPADVCNEADAWFEGGELGAGIAQTLIAYNIKETLLPLEGGPSRVYLPPGTDVVDMFSKGYTPVPVEPGTPVKLYGFVPWGGGEDSPACNCDITWFFDEQPTFRGQCPVSPEQASLLPSRNILDAGEFYGSAETEGRV